MPEIDDLLETIAGMSDGVLAIDAHHRIILWNRGAERIFGYRADEVLGKPCYEVVPGYDRCGSPYCQYGCPVMTAAREGKTTPNYDLRAVDSEGSTVWLNVSILPVPSPQGDLSCVVHIFHDIGRQLAIEEMVQRGVALVNHTVEAPPPPTIPELEEPEPETPAEILTQREQEVLKLMAMGHGTREIAEALYLSTATVRNHIQAVLDKLHVHSRMEAVAYAFGRGLLTTGDAPHRVSEPSPDRPINLA